MGSARPQVVGRHEADLRMIFGPIGPNAVSNAR